MFVFLIVGQMAVAIKTEHGTQIHTWHVDPRSILRKSRSVTVPSIGTTTEAP